MYLKTQLTSDNFYFQKGCRTTDQICLRPSTKRSVTPMISAYRQRARYALTVGRTLNPA
jgi:hypothetical protein